MSYHSYQLNGLANPHGKDWLERFLRGWVFPIFRDFILNPKVSSTRYENLICPIDQSYHFEPVILEEDKEVKSGYTVDLSTMSPVVSEIRPLKTRSKGFGLLYSYLHRLAHLESDHFELFLILDQAKNMSLEQYVDRHCMDRGHHALQSINKEVSNFSQMHTLAKNALLSVNKRRGEKIILLPGRDTHTFAVLSGKYKIPTWYEPTISRQVVSDHNLMKNVFYPWRSKFVMLDTGYLGSIHKNMSKALDYPIPNFMLSSAKAGEEDQVFKNFLLARNFCLALEYLPKFFKTGRLHKFAEGGAPPTAIQNLSNPTEFLKATILTIAIWEHESPSFVKNTRSQNLRRSFNAKDVFHFGFI